MKPKHSRVLVSLLVLALLMPVLSAGGETARPNTKLSLRGDASFDARRLPPDVRGWYDRMWRDLRSPNPSPDIHKLGATGDLWHLGRPWNRGITALLAVMRVTGDLRLLDEIDRSMQAARKELKDWDGDGFLNWRFLDKTNAGLTGHDRGSQMWDMETHALVACVAWAYRVNQDLKSPGGIDYKQRAAFWQDYLKNHFEAKWRHRNGQPEGFPFLEKPLVHPYSHFVRYHHYMARLTGDRGYEDYALVMAARLAKFSYEVETPSGPAIIWRHQNLTGDRTAQPIGYATMTFAAFHDLHLEGFAPYARGETMAKYARTISELIILDGSNSFAWDVAGEVPRADLQSKPRVGPQGKPGRRMTTAGFAGSVLPFFAVWDASGKIERISLEVDDKVRKPDGPHFYFIPAAMVFTKLVRQGYQKG